VRMEKVRVGERFVFGDRGGVWQKTGHHRAKNIYGENHGTEIDVLPDTPVYVHFGDNRDGHRGQIRERRESIQVEPREQSPTQQPEIEKEVGSIFDRATVAIDEEGNEHKLKPYERIAPIEPECRSEVSEPCHPRTNMEGISICVGDDDNEIIKVVGATAAQVAAYMNAEAIIVKRDGGAVDMAVIESVFDHESQTVYIKVRA